jgi:hypothetical protein
MLVAGMRASSPSAPSRPSPAPAAVPDSAVHAQRLSAPTSAPAPTPTASGSAFVYSLPARSGSGRWATTLQRMDEEEQSSPLLLQQQQPPQRYLQQQQHSPFSTRRWCVPLQPHWWSGRTTLSSCMHCWRRPRRRAGKRVPAPTRRILPLLEPWCISSRSTSSSVLLACAARIEWGRIRWIPTELSPCAIRFASSRRSRSRRTGLNRGGWQWRGDVALVPC